MSTLERAIAIAAAAHTGQVDKNDEPYILHPLRVMLGLESPVDRIVAVLHDVVEDSHWSLADLRAEGFSDVVVQAVDAVSHREDETYDDFVARAAANPIGRRVKLADLADNLDPKRIADVTARDFARIEKYRRALAYLNGTS